MSSTNPTTRLDGFNVAAAAFDPQSISCEIAPNGEMISVFHAIGPGGALLVWPAESAIESAMVEPLSELYSRALQMGRTSGLTFAQLLLPDDRGDQRRSLEKAGFVRLTRIFHLRGIVQDRARPDTAPLLPKADESLAMSWRRLAVDGADDKRLADVLARCYSESLDCPEVSDWRTVDQAIDNHRRQSANDQKEWWLLVGNGKEIGVLLLAFDGCGAAAIDYLGLIPERRGQGLGNHIMQFAMQRSLAKQCRILTADIDVRNRPAHVLYTRWGFDKSDVADLYVHRFDG